MSSNLLSVFLIILFIVLQELSWKRFNKKCGSFTPKEVKAIKEQMLTVDSFGGVENIAILLSFVDAYREQQASLQAASELATQEEQRQHMLNINPGAFGRARVDNLEQGTMTPGKIADPVVQP